MFLDPAFTNGAEGIVLGILPLPGDALMLVFRHLLCLLICRVERPGFEKVRKETLGGELFPGSFRQSQYPVQGR